MMNKFLERAKGAAALLVVAVVAMLLYLYGAYVHSQTYRMPRPPCNQQQK